MQSSSSVDWMVIFLLLLIPALWLLVSGLRGRRVGDEPRCVKCGYILLHLKSFHCPECGTELAASNTVIGQRKRRPARAAAGLLLLLVACLPMISPVATAFEQIPWYQFKPAGYVLDDLDTPATYSKAMTELQRRDSAGSLAESARQKLVEKGLQAQADTTSARQELLNYLGKVCVDGQLTQAQKDRFIDNVCEVAMTARPVVGEGDPIPYALSWSGRGPQGKSPAVFWTRCADGDRRIDGKVVRTGGGSITSQLSGSSGSSSNVPAGPVGQHTLEIDIASMVGYGPFGDEAKSQVLGRRDRTVKATYEVLARENAPKIELLDSEELRKRVHAVVKIECLRQQKDGHINGNFNVTNAPCDLAFELFVVTDEGETKNGSIACAKGRSMGYGAGGDVTPRLPPKVKVILRSSEDVAKRTVDLTAIYSGEIVFEDVVMKQEN